MDLNLSERLKLSRKNAGLSQKTASEQLGIAYPTLNKYENGHRTPDAELLKQMAKLYGCNPAWLLSGEETMGGRPELPPDIQEMVDFYMQFTPEVRKRMIEEDKERRIEALRKKKQG